jgi:hypothetical protein
MDRVCHPVQDAPARALDTRGDLWTSLLAWAEHDDQPTRLCGLLD